MSTFPAPLRVGFAGTPEFAASALAAILAAGHAVPLVLTQPDRPAGRGMKLQASPVKTLALAHSIDLAQPRSLRLDGKFPEDARTGGDALRAAALDVLVVAAYGLILPAWVLQTPRLGCLNIHASLLPRWRGAAPIQRAIEAGDDRTGITIMQMDEGLDTGAMLLAEAVPITADDTAATLHDTLAALGARMIVQALARLEGAALTPVAQPAEGVTYAQKIAKAEGPVDWSVPAELLERRLRAFDPFPGASFACGAEAVKLWRASVVDGDGAPGEVLKATPEALEVACGRGALSLREVQRPGGRRLPVAAFLMHGPGAALRPGDRLD